MNNGWIKLHRKFLKWEWCQKSEMVHLFIHLLLSANHEEKSWQGQIIKRGQCVIGRKKLAIETGISEQSIRTCLSKLKSTNEITTKPTNRFTIITIANYDDYQGDERKSTSKSTKTLTNNQPTTNQQLTTTKNVKKIKNDKKIEGALPLAPAQYNKNFFEQGNEWIKSGMPGKDLKGEQFKEIVVWMIKEKKWDIDQAREEIKKFIEYWLVLSPNGKVVRWQDSKNKYFKLKARISTWMGRVNK